MTVIALVTAVLTSLIAAGASLIVALGTAIAGTRFKRRSDAQLAELTAALTEAQHERDAQRDYQYEARKRLYADLQPLLFQLTELCRSARRHTQGLARTARQGHLGSDAGSWVVSDDYYLRSTVYRLMVPVAVLELIRRRLTSLDLSLDDDIRTLYRFASALSGTWNSGFDLAAAAPALEYRPHDEAAKEGVHRHPKIFAIQHLYAGQIDQIVSTMLVKDEDALRYRGYGEFEAAYVDDANVRANVAPLLKIFTGFHPRTHPVLWRMLVVQAHLHKAISRTSAEPSGVVVDPIGILNDEQPEFDWREPGAPDTEDEALIAPLAAAETYLAARLKTR